MEVDSSSSVTIILSVYLRFILLTRCFRGFTHHVSQHSKTSQQRLLSMRSAMPSEDAH